MARLARYCLLAALLLAGTSGAVQGAPRAASQVPGSDPGSVVFVRGTSLWRVSAADGHAVAPVALAELGADAGLVTRLEAAPTGTALLVELGNRVGWIQLGRKPAPGKPASLSMLDCSAPAHFSPDGQFLACTGHNGLVSLHRVGPGEPRVIEHPTLSVIGFTDAEHVLVRDDQGLWSESIQAPAQRALLAPHLPSGALLVAPAGRRAAGMYPPVRADVPTPGLYVFRLDGKAVRRRLLEGGAPVAWSHDGGWLLAQSPSEGACIMRAAGGEYKCWARYQALALAPDGSRALLARPSENAGGGLDLYLGSLDGVRPAPPVSLERGVSGPATWLPAASETTKLRQPAARGLQAPRLP